MQFETNRGSAGTQVSVGNYRVFSERTLGNTTGGERRGGSLSGNERKENVGEFFHT